MKHLFSPWRMKYITKAEKPRGCVFCLAQQQADGPENLILARGQAVFIILNRYPYTTGHLMIVPFAHVASLDEVTAEVRAELMEEANHAVRALQAVYHPQAFNLGINLGAAAGAGVAEHLHLHIVPRWGGDNNFMGVIGETRVLPEDLSETYQRLGAIWHTC